MMVGNGKNRKSLVYVENVAAFIEFGMGFGPGIHTYNFVDKPDFTMNQLVKTVRQILGRSEGIYFRVPFFVGLIIGKGFDLIGFLTKKQFSINSIRIKKFCANSVYSSAVEKTGFVAPTPLKTALEQTILYEFIENND
jgi:nucleoside-diphosphate-sugar epimerase